MPDALPALERMFGNVRKLVAVIGRARERFVPPERVQRLVQAIALGYYESARPELELVQHRVGLVDEMDNTVEAILQLANDARRKRAYLDQIDTLRRYIQEAMICVMKARGNPRLVLSATERGILSTLEKMLPSTAMSYEQVLRDIGEAKRVSWRGTGGELREVLREVIDHLAPDDQVMAAPGFRLEGDLKRPTQKQKVRFILKARRSGSGAVTTAEASLLTIEESIAGLARSTYRRGSVSAHRSTDGSEIRKVKGYVDALLVDLLVIPEGR